MTMLDARHIRAILGIILILSSSVAMAGEWNLPGLMQLLAQRKAGRASFVERKYIGFIDKPMESSGELTFQAPDMLEKRTFKPKPESLLLKGDRLTIDQPDKHKLQVSLQEHPEVSAFIESIRGTLTGDLSTLKEFYNITLAGSVDQWQLVLIPKQARMARIISRIRISGSDTNIQTIDFEQADGDRSEMVITDISVK